MPFQFFRTEKFKKQFEKLDPAQKQTVKKKIEKIVDNPELGKPLHAPLAQFRSERIQNLRIIYAVEGNTIQFAWLDRRETVYR